MEHYDRVWAEIDLNAIAFNIESIKKNISENTQIVAVIKADGYGHGAVMIAKKLVTLFLPDYRLNMKYFLKEHGTLPEKFNL